MQKKNLMIFLSLLLILSMSFSTSIAKEGTQKVNNKKKTNARVVAIFIEQNDGQLIQVTEEEKNNILARNNSASLVATQVSVSDSASTEEFGTLGTTDDWYRYDEYYTGMVERNDLQSIDSNVQYNGTTTQSTFKFNWSKSVSSSFSVSVNSSEKSAIIGGMSYSWNSSESYGEEHEFNVQPGNYGWVEIAPVMNYSTGYVRRFNWLGTEEESKWLTTYISRSTSQLPHRVIYLMESPTSPI